MEYVLQTHALKKMYGNFKALNGLSMNVPRGSIYGFVGKNGAGNPPHSSGLRASGAFCRRIYHLRAEKHAERDHRSKKADGSRGGDSLDLPGYDSGG